MEEGGGGGTYIFSVLTIFFVLYSTLTSYKKYFKTAVKVMFYQTLLYTRISELK